ncbi:MAG: diguanylate cyclase [Clostridia bacterium]
MKKYKKKILIIIISVVLVTFLVVTILLYNVTANNKIKELTIEVLQSSTKEQLHTLKSEINGYYVLIEAYANRLGKIENYDYIEMLEELESIKKVASFSFVAVIDIETGMAIESDDKEKSLDKNGAFFLQAVKQNRSLYYGASGLHSQAHMILSVLVWDKNGAKSIISAGYNEEAFKETLILDIFGKETNSIISDKNGNKIIENISDFEIINGTNVFDELENVKFYNGSITQLKEDLAINKNGIVSCKINKQKYYALYMPLSYNDWHIINIIESKWIDDKTTEFSKQYYILTGMIFVAMALIFVFIYLKEKKRNALLANEKEALRQSEARYMTVATFSDSVLFEGNIETDELKFNSLYKNIYGREPILSKISDLVNEHPYVLKEDADEFKRLGEDIKNGLDHSFSEYRTYVADGNIAWHRMEYKMLYNAIGKPIKIVGKISSVDEKYKKMQKLSTLAEVDSMTGMLNHDATIQKIENYLSGDGKYGRHTLYFIDLDNFKLINDKFGHSEGDKTIASMAFEIKNIFKSNDIVGRIGGDEFLVLQKNTMLDSMIMLKANELSETLQYMHIEKNKEVVITGSVGISIYNANDKSFDALYNEADKALYKAKGKGKNACSFYDNAIENDFGESATSTVLLGDLSRNSVNIQFRTLLNYMMGGVMLLEVSDRVRAIYCSPSFYKMTGRTEEDVSNINRFVDTYVHPDDITKVYNALQSGVTSNELIEITFRTISEKHNIMWRSLRAIKIPYAESKLPVFMAVVNDITEHKKMSAKVESILNNSPDAIIVVEVFKDTAEIIYYNNAVIELLNCSKQVFDRIKLNIYLLINPDYLNGLISAFVKCKAEKTPIKYVIKTSNIIGDSKEIMIKGSYADENNDNSLYLLSLFDMAKDIKTQNDIL